MGTKKQKRPLGTIDPVASKMSTLSSRETTPEVKSPTTDSPPVRELTYSYEAIPEVGVQWEALHNRILTQEETDFVAYVKVLHAVGLHKNKFDCDLIELFKAGDLLHHKLKHPIEFESNHCSKFARWTPLPSPVLLQKELDEVNCEIALVERRRHRLVRIVKHVLISIDDHKDKSRAKATDSILAKLGKKVPQWQHKAAEDMYKLWAEDKFEEIDTVSLSISILTEAEHQKEHKQRWAAASTLPAEDKLPGIMTELERVIIPLSDEDINNREWYVRIEL